MAQTSEFIDRRNPNQRGRRATDSGNDAGADSLVRDAVQTAGRAMASAVGFAAGAAASVARRPGKVDPAAQERYWLENYANEPYYDSNYSFEDYLPAFRTGWEGRAKYAGRSFEDVEKDLTADFHWNRGQSRLVWDQARHAVRAAWDRIASS
jgi:hypothetical protein